MRKNFGNIGVFVGAAVIAAMLTLLLAATVLLASCRENSDTTALGGSRESLLESSARPDTGGEGTSSSETSAHETPEGFDRNTPIMLSLGVPANADTAEVGAKYDGKNGVWFCFTPYWSGRFAVISTAASADCDPCVYFFNSKSGARTDFDDNSYDKSNSADHNFYLEFELAADTTYYFFVANMNVGRFGEIIFYVCEQPSTHPIPDFP